MKQYPQSLIDDTTDKAKKPSTRELISEGQGKFLYQSDKPDLVIQEFRTNGMEEGKKRTPPKAIDALRNRISSYLFEYLAGYHIPTHFVTKLSDTQMAVKRTEGIPLVVKVYNGGNEALAKRFGFKENTPLEFPIIEHYLVNAARTGPMVNEYHVYAFSIASPEEFKQINRLASKINAVLRGLCDRRQLMVTDLQLEFGRHKGQIILADELSPLTCHFVDLAAEDKSRRERFLPGGEKNGETLAELCDRLMLKV
jgi:phosphoribosylaminoimidazole-succinocarboxamide synthase